MKVFLVVLVSVVSVSSLVAAIAKTDSADRYALVAVAFSAPLLGYSFAKRMRL